MVKITVIAAAFALLACAQQAHANICPIPEVYTNPQECDQPPPVDAECIFTARQDDSSPLQTYVVNQPVPANIECFSAPGGMFCEGWAQATSAHLQYAWRVRVGNVYSSTYCTGADAYTDFVCSPNQPVQVTMTLENGNYSASLTRNFSCGAATQ